MTERTEEKIVKVAVIGSGLAGLSAAYLLTKGVSTDNENNVKFQVHLFEKNNMIGMDAASISIGSEDKNVRIDVPMRSFMSGYYSHLINLYKHLGIPAKPARFSFGWYTIESSHPIDNKLAHDIASYTNNQSYLTYSGARTVGRLQAISRSSLSKDDIDSTPNWTLRVNDLLISWYFMIVVALSYSWLMILTLWLHHRGHLRNPQHSVAKMTLGQWLKENHIHPYFIHQVFVPLFAAVCTNSWGAMLNYPASEVLEYMAMGLFQESYVVTQGIRQVVDRLAEPLTHIHLGVHIKSIQPDRKNGYRYVLQDEQDQTYEFDHIIFATQGNQAKRMLETCYTSVRDHHNDITNNNNNNNNSNSNDDAVLISTLEAQLNMLKQFSYDTSLVINHTDTRLLPKDKTHWRALNFARIDHTIQPDPKNDNKYIIPFPHDTTMTTHILNWTHSCFNNSDDDKSDEDDLSDRSLYLQTTNPCISPDPKHIISVSWFERATVTLASKRAIESDLFPTTVHNNNVTLGACQGTNGIWFVGSYCWRGIPLLEGCVASAEKVVLDGLSVQEGVNLKRPW
ncbi:hypothetical protein BC941DRAFT_385385 [Chlamydoabsidia padenii]|nr:hypothetical protein BC941DRAFT_385385 [Chlamydoabsidia padenii]